MTAALLIIDVQKGLDDPALGERNNPQAEENIAELLSHWRDNGWPIIHVRHDSTEPDSPLRAERPGNAIKDEVAPRDGEPLFIKSVNSAFIGTGLQDYLDNHGIRELVVTGLTTEHCVSTSVRMASNLGYRVTLISDATAAFARPGADGTMFDAQTVHQINVASLSGEFCEVKSTRAVTNRA